MFSISLSPEAARRQADITKDMKVVTEKDGNYLSEQLKLYLDDQEVDRLNVAADLKGRAVTEIAISGSGVGTTEQTAMFDALKNMKRLQTILITGSLPVKLTVVKIDNVSPFLGVQFLKNAVYMGLLATIAVALVIYIRELYLGIRTYELVVAVPIGLWGILNIREKNREAAFAIALLAIISDLVIETLIIGAGGYHYANGFTLLIPMTYGMLVLGMLGLIEQSHRLDAMLDAPQIQKLLRIFGVQRFVNRELRKK